MRSMTCVWNSVNWYQIWSSLEFQLTLLCSFVAGEAIARIIPHRPRLVTLQDSKVRHPTPLFPYHVRISRNLARRLPFERDTAGNMQIFAYLQPYLCWIVHVFWIAGGCVDGVSFHALLVSETEFQQHLPVVLRIHNLLARTCIWRTAGRCCRNSVSDRSRAWKLTPSTHPRVGLGPIFTY